MEHRLDQYFRQLNEESNRSITDGPDLSETRGRKEDVLDEFFLILRSGVDGRSLHLLLAATAGSKVDTAKETAENAHGKLQQQHMSVNSDISKRSSTAGLSLT